MLVLLPRDSNLLLLLDMRRIHIRDLRQGMDIHAEPDLTVVTDQGTEFLLQTVRLNGGQATYYTAYHSQFQDGNRSYTHFSQLKQDLSKL